MAGLIKRRRQDERDHKRVQKRLIKAAKKQEKHGRERDKPRVES